MLRKILIVGFGLWLHTSASALGLGEIQLESALNEPLVAEIPISVSSRDELRGFRARVALNDTFARYGLDRPVFLNSLTFFVADNAAGQPVLAVRSNRPIAEPFVTFLLEATWDGGRLLREYTVLLDPPVFNDQAVSAPVNVAQSVAAQPSTRSGRVTQAPAAPAPQPAPRPVYRQPAISGQMYGPVQRNQNLWNISRSVELNGVSINQMMVAIYRANPEAFMGNINLLREGATLQIPDAASVSNLLRSEANSLVVAHNADWRSGRVTASGSRVASSSTATGSRAQRLKLVAPDGSAAGAGTEAGSAELDATRELLANEKTENETLSSELESVRAELEETKERLINLQNADLAELQGSLANEDTPPVVDESAPEQPVVEATDPTEPVVDETSGTDTESATSTVTDPTTLLEPQVNTPVETDKPAMTIEVEEPVEASSLMSKLIGLAKNWLVWGGLALLSLIGLFFFMFRRREEESAEPWDALEVDVDDSGLDLDASLDKVAQQTMAKDSLDVSRDVEYFEDTGTFKPIDFDSSSTGQVPAIGAATDHPPFEDTLAGETGVKLDQADTLSEADFHMAYGLYDQAAELVGKASAKEPERIDLRMKLLEIFFVWGNKDEFRSSAAEVQGLLTNMPGEWEKILIMGKQICPGDELFAGDATGDIMGDGVDLQLETASTDMGGLDFQTEDFGGSDVFSEDADDVVDLDLGDALFASDDPPTATGVDSNVLDFSFDGADDGNSDGDEPTASTEEVKEKIEQALSSSQGEDTEEMDLDQLGIDLDFGDITSVSEGTSGEFEVQDANSGTEASEENFDELFDGLGDVDDTPSTIIDAGMIADADTHDKLLDTSELKVEMEELLSADTSGLFDKDETSRGVESLIPDADMLADLPDEPSDETGSFSAEIRSLADDKLEIGEELAATSGNVDFGLGDDDETVLQEALVDPTAEPVEPPKTETDTSAEREFDDVFGGSDDETVLQSTLVADSAKVDLSEPFGDSSQDTTAMPAIEADDLDFGLGDENSDNHAATFQGVFDSPDGTQEMPTMDGFSDDVFPSPDGRTQEMQAMDLDVGETVDDTGDNTTMRVATSNLALPENAELAINEVGTKLDLARAYLDMGDPDGARTILEEVMQEGNEGQQADARTLLDGLS